MDLSTLNNDQVHAVAAHLAVAEAIVRTRRPAEVISEARRYRLRLDGKLAQVTARRTGEWQVSDATRPLLDDTEVLVLVDFIPELPEFYVMPAEWFRADVEQRYAAFMNRVGSRPRNPDSKHHSVRTADVEQWRGRWAVIAGEAT
ncbi:hypothetical protein DMH01_15550 [Amycolatopsis sp. WAC 04182]|uniref:hypothetical protein n=1 Tax=Amycolatopsis sp. WAC 04182 TaxID=2203198 RepID=UPI000F7A97DD|nr:hypothetical protein [Amycolatopsis sp. WAC 04182]RSN60695.1 hypothetical protein DMH01_15550 [Amycolatopsis sp. WAC 04182]